MIVGSKRKRQAPVAEQLDIGEALQPETNEEMILTFIASRDYSGAATFIDFLKTDMGIPYTKDLKLWHGYALFHLGQYEAAIDLYRKLLEDDPEDTIVYLFISSCQFYLQEYEEARESAEKGPSCDYRTRLIFHIANQVNDEKELIQSHSQLVGTNENQLSLAAIHYMRRHYTDAIEIYTKLLAESPDHVAFHVYIAMCQYKLGLMQQANDSVDEYLAQNSDSAVALNLKSCAYLDLYDPQNAESQLLQIKKFSSATYGFVDGLINHNLCVFHNGDDGFTVFPPLVDALPEARMNLAILYLRESNAKEAYSLVQDFQPLDDTECVLKATVDLAYGQIAAEEELIISANEVFAEVSAKEDVKNTVQGRQAMATNKFIQNEFESTLKILDSVQEHIGHTDEFNYNEGMTFAAMERWAEAEQAFLRVQNTAYTKEVFYTSWLCRCYIMNGKPEKAFELYTESTNTEDAKTLLQIISSDCFNRGQYYYAMKAYDVLSKVELDPLLRDGMIASAVGVFRNVLTRKEGPERLGEVLDCLASDPDALQVYQTIANYIETSGEFAEMM